MKSNELMIGDWVMWCDKPYRIYGIIQGEYREWEREWVVALSEHEGYHPCVNELKPIPLTAEILEKNGFEKTRCGIGATVYTFSDNDEYYALAVDEYTDSIWRIEYTTCEMNFPLIRIMVCFVHEFQRVLKMCNIDKEIEL